MTPISPGAAALINKDGPVTVDQVLDILQSTCSELTIVADKVKDGNRLLRKMEYIKVSYIWMDIGLIERIGTILGS